LPRCIEKWLLSLNVAKGKCPQCNAPAKKTDIRILFTNNITVVNDPKKDKLSADLLIERQLRTAAEKKAAEYLIKNQIFEAELGYMRQQLSLCNEKIENYKKKISLLSFHEPTTKKSRLGSPFFIGQLTYSKTLHSNPAGTKAKYDSFMPEIA
jgi:hypothetical protein